MDISRSLNAYAVGLGTIGLAFLLAACSSASDPRDDAGGDGGGESSVSGTGGKPGTTAGPGTSTTGAGAGGPSSGGKTCSSAADCGQLSCEHASIDETGICASSCSTDSDCAGGHTCVDGSSIGFDPSCLQTCSSSGQCGGGMECAEIGGGLQVCLPSGWVAAPSSKKGIGDACAADGDCTSGWCVGWCTEPCSPGSNFCGGDYGGKNEFGTWNWCVQNGNGDDICFPGCGSSTDCYGFPGTSCQSGQDVASTTVDICST